jgi:hypothetical protein
MAIYHLDAKVISRGKGQNAIAAAAYRSGERLYDEEAAQQKYYPSPEGRIVFTDIMAPKDAPEWVHDRNTLWNNVERRENRKDAQLAREFEIGLPHELTDKQREWLIKDFAREAFVRHGYAVDIAIHAPTGDSDKRNDHAHLMVTMRTLGPEGFAAKKDRSLNSPEQLEAWREQWETLANRHLERHGHEARIDRRSLKEQGIDREPTVHLGYAAAEMAKRGAESDRVNQLLGILDRNEIRVDLKAMDEELKRLQEIKAQEQKRDELAKTEEQKREDMAKAERAAKIARFQADMAARAAAPPKPERRGPEPQVTRPHIEIQIDHAVAEAEARRIAEATARRVAARKADMDAAMGKGWELGTATEASGWKKDPAAPALPPQSQPQPGAQPATRPTVEERPFVNSNPVRSGLNMARSGLHVANSATGKVTKLADFIIDFLSRGTTPVEGKQVDVNEFTMDPAKRKEQQRARLGARDAEHADEKALESIAEHMRAGKHLKPEDIQNLTRQHQEEIRNFGDSAVQQMVDDARKRAERLWRGDERELER